MNRKECVSALGGVYKRERERNSFINLLKKLPAGSLKVRLQIV